MPALDRLVSGGGGSRARRGYVAAGSEIRGDRPLVNHRELRPWDSAPSFGEVIKVDRVEAARIQIPKPLAWLGRRKTMYLANDREIIVVRVERFLKSNCLSVFMA